MSTSNKAAPPPPTLPPGLETGHIFWLVGWLCFTSHRQRGHLETAPPPPHLLSLAKDVKLSLYTVPTGNRTPGRRVAVHYTTAVPHQLHFFGSNLIRQWMGKRTTHHFILTMNPKSTRWLVLLVLFPKDPSSQFFPEHHWNWFVIDNKMIRHRQ